MEKLPLYHIYIFGNHYTAEGKEMLDAKLQQLFDQYTLSFTQFCKRTHVIGEDFDLISFEMVTKIKCTYGV